MRLREGHQKKKAHLALKKGLAQMSNIDNLSDAEIRAEFAKIQEQKAKQREYMSRPEVKAKMAEYNRERTDRRKAILARAKELGLDN